MRCAVGPTVSFSVSTFPARGHLDEEPLVGLPPVAARGTVRALVVFPLVPQDAADAGSHPGLPCAPEETPADRGRVLRINRVALVLVDARTAAGAIDDGDRNPLALDGTPGQLLIGICFFAW